MNKRSHTLKRPIALIALGFLVTLSLAAEANPRNYSYWENHVSSVPVHQSYAYRGHGNQIRRGHEYSRFDSDRYVAPHRRQARRHGGYAGIDSLLRGRDHSNRRSHSRRRGHR